MRLKTRLKFEIEGWYIESLWIENIIIGEGDLSTMWKYLANAKIEFHLTGPLSSVSQTWSSYS